MCVRAREYVCACVSERQRREGGLLVCEYVSVYVCK